MAIFNSIVLGKSRGKIGNVVTTTLKGQSVAKQRNYSPANPKTVLQTTSRAKMSNAVMAWQFLAVFLTFITALRKPLESNYNAFIRLTKNFFTNVIAESGSMASAMLLGMSFSVSNFITVSVTDPEGTDVVVVFKNGGLPYLAGSNVRLINYVAATGENLIVDREILEVEWNNETLTLIDGATIDGLRACYIYNKTANKCSNLCFVHN